MYTPTLFEFVRKAEQGNLIPVYREFVADTDTPVSAFMKLRQAGTGENAFLLESVAGGAQIARYSYLGIDPLEVVATKGRSATIGENGSSRRIEIPEGQDRWTSSASCWRATGSCPSRAVTASTAAPWATSATTWCVSSRRSRRQADDLNLPDACFMLTDTLVIFDHVTRKLRVVANAHVTGDPRRPTGTRSRASTSWWTPSGSRCRAHRRATGRWRASPPTPRPCARP